MSDVLSNIPTQVNSISVYSYQIAILGSKIQMDCLGYNETEYVHL